MPSIHIMNEHLANKIAAGEVVERPSSVVKELLENAIDAKSSVIEVNIEEGGLSKIIVSDNGIGMEREDCRLAFERHATSKVLSDRDLFHISTLGFRGEALPSIAAVSRVSLHTWNGQEETGTKLKMDNGKVVELEDAPLRQGTVIHISDLFYNTPARYKYLKTVHTELSHISDIMNRLALAYPKISFKLNHNGRQLMSTKGNGELISVVSSIYGLQTAKQMIPFQASHIDFEIEGFLGNPQLTRSNRQYISLFLNGRYVRHSGINQSILKAYHTLLPIHRYPIVILSIKMEASLLDSNVHPNKMEVRVSKEKELLEWLEEEMRNRLTKELQIPSELKQKQDKERNEQQSITFQLPDKTLSDIEVPTSTTFESSSDYAMTSKIEQVNNEQTNQAVLGKTNRAIEKNEKNKMDKPQADTKNSIEEGIKSEADHISGKEVAATKHPAIPVLHPIGQLHGTYILAQNEKGMYMIDQHAAQERIYYEYFYDQLNLDEAIYQDLLVPLVLEYTAGEALLVKENLHQLEKIGLFLEEFGHHSYILRSHPQWFPEVDLEGLVREIIDYVIDQKGKLEWITFREKASIMMSCKKAIKANRYLTLAEMEALVETLRKTTNPFTCPHGRPITILLSTYEIEKMFKRVM